MEVSPGYKHTELGIIPEDWIIKTLGELGSFKNGINKDAEDFGYGSPFINLMDVFGVPIASEITEKLGLVNSTLEEQKNYELKAGDVLFVRSSIKPEGVGLTTLIPNDLATTVFSGFLIRFRDQGQLVKEFKKHCFFSSSIRKSIIANSTVSANTNINQEALKLIQLVFPPKHKEQQAIAEVLSDMDALLESLERLILKKRDLKQAFMQQILTGKTRLSGFMGEWKNKRLDNITRAQKGQLITKNTLTPGSVPVIAGGKQPAYFHSLANRFGKTITISASGASAGYVAFHSSPIFASDCSTISESNSYCIEFLYYFLSLRQEEIYNLQTGGAQPHINPKDIAPMLIQIPSDIAEQSVIANILSDIDTELLKLEVRRNKTQELKQAMMQELLTGKKRLVNKELIDA